jgi:hypothetical protein
MNKSKDGKGSGVTGYGSREKITATGNSKLETGNLKPNP